MLRMNIKNNYLKYIVLALVIVFLISAAFMLLEIWETQNGKYLGSNQENDFVTYNGTEYVKKDNIETFLVLGIDRYEGADAAESHTGGVQADFFTGAVKAGDVLGTIFNALEGEPVETVVAPEGGLVFTQRRYSAVYPGTLIARLCRKERA